MYYYYNPLLTKSGDILPDYLVRLLDASSNEVDIFADDSGTPIASVSGVTNAAKADDLGMVRFWVPNGIYDIAIYDTTDTFKKREDGVPMFDAGTLASDLGSTDTDKGASLVKFESGNTVEDLASSAVGKGAALITMAGGGTAQEAIIARPTSTVLAASGGAALLGAEAGGTVQDALDGFNTDISALEQVNTVTGISGNAPNVTQFPNHNFLNSGSAASAVSAGTVDQPNVNGGKVYITSFAGDGTTDDFVVTPGFTVDDVAYRNILVYLVTTATRAETLQSETTHYTVSGKGTGTVTISMITPPTAEQGIRVRVYRKENSSYSPLLNYVSRGYDNANDGSGSMVIMDGAHHINIGNTGGHNAFLGGAGNTMRGATSYSGAIGLSHDLNAALAGVAGGMRGYLTGTAPTHFGASGTVGGWAFHVGDGGIASLSYSAHFGRRGATRIPGDIVQGIGAAADTEAGLAGRHSFALRRYLTTATTTTLTPALSTPSYFAMPENSKAYIEADVMLSEVGTDNFRTFRLVSCVRRATGSTMSFCANSTYADQATILEENGVSATSAEWQAQIYTSASGGFQISGRGKSGLTIQAIAHVRVLLIADGAASV